MPEDTPNSKALMENLGD